MHQARRDAYRVASGIRLEPTLAITSPASTELSDMTYAYCA